VDDPDAMWKPGFTGEVVYVRPTGRGRMARPLVAGLGVALAAAVAGTLALTLHGGTTQPASSSAVERIPATAEARWSANVPGWVDAVVGSADVVVATSSSGRPAITALGGRDGHRRWSEPSPGGVNGAVSVVDGVVVYSHGARRPRRR
jgi:outer membrane protein assembly factor BamB